MSNLIETTFVIKETVCGSSIDQAIKEAFIESLRKEVPVILKFNDKFYDIRSFNYYKEFLQNVKSFESIDEAMKNKQNIKEKELPTNVDILNRYI
jgi:hypothetical protein